MHRVFITGIGVVTPIGIGQDAFWESLQAGRSGVRQLSLIDTSELAVKIGGEIADFDPTSANMGPKVAARKMDRSSQFAVVAAGQALKDAQLPDENLDARMAVILGSGLAGLVTFEAQMRNLLNKGPRSVSPFTIPLLMPNAPPANVSLAFGITGTAYNVASACSSSGHAMIDSFCLLRRGEADVVVTGGCEATLTSLAISAFSNMKAVTKKFNDRPTEASRPFDADRDGFVMSEGSAILIFETEESMLKRGATPYCEVVGYGATSDSHHLVQPDLSAKGAAQALELCLNEMGVSPADIAGRTYVNAHGTSTAFNDQMETEALKRVFGDDAKKLKISSTKSMTGHLIGGAGAVEMATCALALRDQVLPPTINYTTPDPNCDLDYIPNEAQKADIAFALNNTFGFGGHNVSLAVKKV